MPLRIEDYALIGDTETAALVGNDGSIDWLCLPRFDSAACFAKLVGDDENGFWRIAPTAPVLAVHRRYREDTLVLETDFETADAVVRLIDFMPPRDGLPDLMRIVEVLSGSAEVHIDLRARFGYGEQLPWIRERNGDFEMIAGPDALHLDTSMECGFQRVGHALVARFTMQAGERRTFRLGWFASHGSPGACVNCDESLEYTERWWREWIGDAGRIGPWSAVVRRSLITLKALTYSPTGAIVAAPTTSLPEKLGGARNWDYRYCWLRDAAYTLGVFLRCGFREEAAEFRDWVLRAIAGDPHQIQIMYGVAGERWLAERELPWLAGYEGSRPVRVGNGAFDQFQLDIVGEVLEVSQLAWSSRTEAGEGPAPEAWEQNKALLDYLAGVWRNPDRGIWEVRGPERHFVHSKVMAWVAFDRAIWFVEHLGLDGPVDEWRKIAAEIHAEVCAKGFDPERNTFVQCYGEPQLDASVLLIGLTHFLPWNDPRVVGTVVAIERDLSRDGLVTRYRTSDSGTIDGIPGHEGVFLPCSLWMVECLAYIGRLDDAHALFDRVLAILNDVDLVAEEYEPAVGRQVGNFPQAFTHVFLVHAALTLQSFADDRA